MHFTKLMPTMDNGINIQDEIKFILDNLELSNITEDWRSLIDYKNTSEFGLCKPHNNFKIRI